MEGWKSVQRNAMIVNPLSELRWEVGRLGSVWWHHSFVKCRHCVLWWEHWLSLRLADYCKVIRMLWCQTEDIPGLETLAAAGNLYQSFSCYELRLAAWLDKNSIDFNRPKNCDNLQLKGSPSQHSSEEKQAPTSECEDWNLFSLLILI